MKNKKLIYILFPVTIIIWGLVVYKIFIYKGNNNKRIFNNSIHQPEDIKKDVQAPDTFSLLLNYRDPFLDKANSNIVGDEINQKDHSSVKKKDLNKINEKKSVEWPTIVYRGIVKNVTSDNTICLVKVNGKSKFFKSGEIKDDIKLLEIYKDSIVVLFNNEKKIFFQKNTKNKKEYKVNVVNRL